MASKEAGMRRGEVWWYEREDDKPRPVLLLTRNEAAGLLNRIIVVPTTKTMRKIPTEVSLDQEDGVPEACVLSLDNTFSARKALLTDRIVTLDAAKMAEVCKALAYATGC